MKTLSSEQLAQFQERGEIVVEGHTLTLEDSRYMQRHTCITMVTRRHKNNSVTIIIYLRMFYAMCTLAHITVT